MELDIAEELHSPPPDPRVRAGVELLSSGYTLYNGNDATAALSVLVDADKHWRTMGADAPAELVRDTQYLMYKAYVKSNTDKSRTVSLPMSFLQLESIIANDKAPERRRAVWLVENLGRLGLYIQDQLERSRRR